MNKYSDQSLLIIIIIIIILIQLNFLYIKCLLSNPVANYKVSTRKRGIWRKTRTHIRKENQNNGTFIAQIIIKIRKCNHVSYYAVKYIYIYIHMCTHIFVLNTINILLINKVPIIIFLLLFHCLKLKGAVYQMNLDRVQRSRTDCITV
jgi:hypothetical protein